MRLEDLFRDTVEKAIGAKIVSLRHWPRSGWNGEDLDIQHDFVVLWRRGGSEYGIHSGAVSHRTGQDAASWIFWGKYDLPSREEGERAFEERCGLQHAHSGPPSASAAL